MAGVVTSAESHRRPTLAGVYHRRPPADIAAEIAADVAAAGGAANGGRASWYGTFDLELDLDGVELAPGSQLAVWCQVVLDPGPDSNATVVERITGHVVLAPRDEGVIDAEGRWRLDGMRCRHPARHANDGPEAAYVITPDGTTTPVNVMPPRTSHVTTRPAADRDAAATDARVDRGDNLPSLLPMPTDLQRPGSRAPEPPASGDGAQAAGRGGQRVRVAAGADVGAAIVALASRLGVDVFTEAHDAPAPDDDTVADERRVDDVLVDVHVDDRAAIAPSGYVLTCRAGRATITASDDAGARHGLVTLAQLAAAGEATSVEVRDAPAMAFRGVHLDLARRWYDPDVVARLIDLAAWRKLTHVHLHLTDDEAWRFPVPDYPRLAEVAARRGHGLAVPPVCASGEGPYGRAYTADEIGRWVEAADRLGIVLVPEVDVPGHCFAVLAAMPELRDPDDTSGAVSVQGFVDNVLVPGHPGTAPFLRAVFGALADLFPSSPTLHIGGDEVPHGAWSGSPLARAYADRHGLSTTHEIEAQFHRDLIAMIRDTTGRDVAMWEEAAFASGEPAAYAVAWTSAAAGRRLAEGGHRVVMSPGEAYYLDMAFSHAWEAPGTVWAGTVPLATTCDFDPSIDGIDELPGEVIGVQACIWSEHIGSLDTLDELAFPRLDAIAERAWTGTVAGGPASLARRSATLPRFVF